MPGKEQIRVKCFPAHIPSLLDSAMRTVQATKVKVHLQELLRTVESGETIAITRRGRTIAHVVPAPAATEQATAASRREAVERFIRSRRRWKPCTMSLEDILRARHEGHRY